MNHSSIYSFCSVLAFVFLSHITLKGQNPNSESENKSHNFINNLSVSPSVGFLHSYTDLGIQPSAASFFRPSENKLGFGLTVNYDFLEVLRLSGGVLGGKLRATSESINTLGAVNEPRDLGLGVFFQTNILELTFPKIDLNLTKLIFKDKSELFNKLSAHVNVSHGLIFFDSKVYALEDESVHLLYGKHRGQSSETTEAISTFGFDLSYMINEKFEVNAGSAIKYIWNDRLDAWESPNSANDYMSYTSVGCTYYFGKGKRKNKKTSYSEEITRTNSSEKAAENHTLDTLKPKLIVNEEPEVNEEVEVAEKDSEVVQKEVNKIEDKVDSTTAEVEQIKEAIIEREIEPEVSDTIIDSNKIVEPQQPPSEIYSGKGNFIIVAAFQTLRRAKISAEEYKKKGELATIVRNRTKTMYLVSVGRYDDREEAISKMREVRKNGIQKDAWVFYSVVEQ